MFPSVLAVLLAALALGVADELHFEYEAYNGGQWGTFPTNYYRSVDAKTPQLQVNIWNKELMSKAGSHIFLRHDGHTPGADTHALDAAPLILRTEDLTAVYVNRSYNAVFNVNVQQDRGIPYLTYYGGPKNEIGVGNGSAHALDMEYREVYHVAAQNLTVKADIHEFALTGEGTALVTAYELVSWDLSPYVGSPRAKFGMIKDSIFQEIDLDTDEVLFQWRASEHIDMHGSYEQIRRTDLGWDFFHINSVQKSKAGDYLISARHMHAVYMISGETGDVMWTLGGKSNEFEELPYPEGEGFGDPLLTMAWQHHAQFYPGSDEKEITLFDNHVLDVNGFGCTSSCSRGVHFRLDYGGKTVQLLHEYRHPAGLQSQSQGSMQVLDNGNVLVGWGRNPAFTEHLPDGTVVLDVQFSPWRSPATGGDGLDNYRAYRADWTGVPHWGPDIAAERSGDDGSVTVWASWNGATEVAEWVVLGHGRSVDGLDGAGRVTARGPRQGFETELWFEGRGELRYVRAAALNAAGDVIGSTGVVDLENGGVVMVDYPVTSVDKEPEEEEEEEQGKEGDVGESSDAGTYLEYYSSWSSPVGLFLRVSAFGFVVWGIARFL